MTNFHPDNNLLTEYAAGTLPTAQAIAMRAHLHYCPNCCAEVKNCERIGGELMHKHGSAAMSSGALDRMMERLKHSDIEDPEDLGKKPQSCSVLPAVITKLVPEPSKLKWSSITKHLKTAPIEVGQDQFEVSFHKIYAGGKVLEHDHRGSEITVVLKGSFSDENGIYRVGDFILREPGDVHRPLAAQNEDCLCFTVVEAPIKLTGFFSRLLNPFLPFKPA